MNGSFVFARKMKFVSIFISFSLVAPEINNKNFPFLLNYIHQKKCWREKRRCSFQRLEIAFNRSFSWCWWSFDVWCFQLHYIKLFSVTCKQTQRKKRMCQREERKRPKAAVTRVVPFNMNAFGVCKRFYCNPCVELEKLRWTTEHLGQKEMGDDENGTEGRKGGRNALKCNRLHDTATCWSVCVYSWRK